MMINPDAMIAAASEIGRSYGYEGYRIETVVGFFAGSVLLQVFAADGGRFWVGSTRYGNTVHAEQRDRAELLLGIQVKEEAKP